ncbi:MAG: hypothetical protein WBM90_12510 [Acidimicrobiia bacterium]
MAKHRPKAYWARGDGGATSASLRRGRAVGLLLIAAVAVACTASDTEPTTSPAGPTAFPVTTTTSITLPHPDVDLLERPQIWFGPQPPLGPNEFGTVRTGPEFYDLFETAAPWQSAAQRVDVLHFFGEWVAWRSSDEELQQVVDDLNRRGIAIAYEGGPLTPIEGCSDNIEGFAGSNEARVIVDRVAAVGGRITYVSLEHPFDAIRQLTDECAVSLVDAAIDMRTYIETVRDVFPAAEFGLIDTGDLDQSVIATYLEAYQQGTGEYPTHLMLDIGYDEPGWPTSALEIEELVHGLGIEFGIFYLGFDHDQSDREWLDHMKERIVEYEVLYGGKPDRPIFESWHPYPQTLLPDTDPAAFTEVLNWYARIRTSMTIDAVDGPSDLEVSGTLTDVSGAPLADEPIQIKVLPGEPESLEVMEEYVLTGVSPAGATTVDVGYRINDECECAGKADVILESFQYSEDGGANLVVNSDFSSEVVGWNIYGAEDQTVVPDGFEIHVTETQIAGATSDQFPITPVTPFTATIRARVSPQSDGNGHFFVIFHNGDQDLRRIREHIRPSRRVVAETTTNADGRYQVGLTPVEFPSIWEAWYSGSDGHWPALASTNRPS